MKNLTTNIIKEKTTALKPLKDLIAKLDYTAQNGTLASLLNDLLTTLDKNETDKSLLILKDLGAIIVKNKDSSETTAQKITLFLDLVKYLEGKTND